jgi:hypothetical protein
MSFGNNGAGPLGAPIFGNQSTTAAGAVPGQAGAPANGATPFYNAGFESVLAAVSRGEVSLNTVVNGGNQFGGVGNVAGNPTLLQAISQGNPQNGTNGLNGVGAGGGTVNSSYASVNTNPGTFGISDGGQTINAKRLMNDAVSVQLSNPLQYGGN